jgi:hypothetical protein
MNNTVETKTKTIRGFEVRSSEECCICGAKNIEGVREMVTKFFGIGESSGCEEFCEKCFKENTFQNSNGFTFLKISDDLFCYKPYYYLDFGFRPVLSQRDIDRAFDPERYEFNKWLNK